MKKRELGLSLSICLYLLLFAVACDGNGGDGDSDTGSGDPLDVDLVGALHKGPFVLGSSVDVAPLDSEGNPTGQVFSTSTINDLGEFAVSFNAIGMVKLEGEGFYYNEITGQLSNAPIVLRALFEIVEAGTQSAYVNLITHLSHDRALKLIVDGETPTTAIASAETDLRVALEIGPPDLIIDAEGTAMNINGGDDLSNAYLLAVSAVIEEAARERAGPEGSIDAALQELVNGISIDLQTDGKLSTSTVAELAQAEAALDPEFVMDMLGMRLAELGSTQSIPDINRVIDTDDDGVVNADDNCRWIANPDQEVIDDALCLVMARRAGVATTAKESYGGGVAIGDLDGDGVGELVVVRDGALTIFTLEDDGSLAQASSIAAPVAAGAIIAEVTGDSNLDVIASGAADGSLHVFSGNGTLEPSSPLTSAGMGFDLPHSVFRDLDGGGLDFVPPWSTSMSSGEMVEMNHELGLGNGDGTFTIAAITISIPSTTLDLKGNAPMWVGAEDFDGDDTIDFGYISKVENLEFVMAPGNGDGTFGDVIATSIPDTSEVGSSMEMEGGLSVGIGDINQDDVIDIIVLESDGTIWCLPGDGVGGFGTPVSSAISFPSGDLDFGLPLVIADFTGDGFDDVAAIIEGGITRSFAVAPGNGTGAFDSALVWESALLTSGESFGYGDLDGNGTFDLASVLTPDSGFLAASFLVNP